MKTLLILRHGKSSWDDPDLADHDRRLKKRGKRDALRMGKLIASEELVPDLIVSSTAERACRTAELVAEHCGYTGAIQQAETLYHGSPEDFKDLLSAVTGDPDCVLIVGHNPDFEEFLQVLTGRRERMPTAALARVSLPIESWRELKPALAGTLADIWRPKELK